MADMHNIQTLTLNEKNLIILDSKWMPPLQPLKTR
jgi:hypothetical protein